MSCCFQNAIKFVGCLVISVVILAITGRASFSKEMCHGFVANVNSESCKIRLKAVAENIRKRFKINQVAPNSSGSAIYLWNFDVNYYADGILLCDEQGGKMQVTIFIHKNDNDGLPACKVRDIIIEETKKAFF